MTYYNLTTKREYDKLPNTIGAIKGVVWPRDKQTFLDAGWRKVEAGAPVPEGMHPTGAYSYAEKDAETVIKTALWITPEAWEAEKQAELEARREAEENKDIFKIIFRMCNLHRPDNMKITVGEAKAIVDQVIAE